MEDNIFGKRREWVWERGLYDDETDDEDDSDDEDQVDDDCKVIDDWVSV